MKTKLFLLTILSFILTVSCGDDNDDDKLLIMTIASEKVKAVDPVSLEEREYLFVKEGDNEKWNVLAEEIKGFEYTIGFEYIIKVKKQYVKNPPQDASCYEYSLLEIISKTKRDN